MTAGNPLPYSVDEMAIGPYLPALRRYARAAMGSPILGDAVLADCLPRMTREKADRDGLLRRLIAATDASPLAPLARADTLPGAIARLPALSRHALLLTRLEGLGDAEAAHLLGVPDSAFRQALAAAQLALAPLQPARILIIGDGEGEMARAVRSLGHAVCGRVANEDAACHAAARMQPDLVLAEATLPDGGSGVIAAHRIAANDPVPVVLVGGQALAAYGYPVVGQPLRHDTLRLAIGRALRGRHGRAG